MQHDDAPAVGAGNTLTVTYRDSEGEEVFLTHTSGPGLPPPCWQAYEELQRLGIPRKSVLAVHSELGFCRLPGCYCDPMLRGFAFPDAEFSIGCNYGDTPRARAAAVESVRERAAMLAQMTGLPAVPAAVPVPIPVLDRAEPVDGEQLGRVLFSVFGPGGVRRYGPGELPGDVPPGTRHTLAVAGLPVQVPHLFKAWDLEPMQAMLRKRGPLDEGAVARYAGWRTLGSDGHCVIGVEPGGALHAVDPELGTRRFVSSDAASFARSLALLTRGRQRMKGRAPHAAAAVVAGVQAQLAGIDPAAVRDPDAWWPLLAEQMWHGLL
ncbi:SUKH-4 family immunity protein [Actinomadura macrotermitis]|nr:SUKH-4 family immunity protein [Actinomadura macrotermitis]